MQIKFRHWLVSVVLIGALMIGGCASQQTASLSSETPSDSQTTSTPVAQAGDMQMENLPRLEGKATVVMRVNGSPITIEVDGTNAPITAGNFVDLVQRGVYDNLVFHRVVREPQPFVVQGGDPQSKDPSFPASRLGVGSFIDPATSQPRYIPLEIKPEGAQTPVYGQTLRNARVSQPPVLKHSRGAVAMARANPPNSASSQFYFALTELPFLDGDYAVFGYVTDGMDVVDQIQQGDRIDSAQVVEGAENLKQGGQ